jgi:hypothetical protein
MLPVKGRYAYDLAIAPRLTKPLLTVNDQHNRACEDAGEKTQLEAKGKTTVDAMELAMSAS